MPVENTRVVILGTPKASKDFDLFDAERVRAEKGVEEVEAAALKTLGQLYKAQRELQRELPRRR